MIRIDAIWQALGASDLRGGIDTLLAQAGYGVDTAFRERLTAIGLSYVAGVTGQVTVWPPGHAPQPSRPYTGRGKVATRLRLGDARHEQPLSIKEVAFGLRPDQWHDIEWREGTNFTLRSRFARVRVRAAHREHLRTEQRPQEWLLIEWPEGHKEPMKYWLSTLPEDNVRPQSRVFWQVKTLPRRWCESPVRPVFPRRTVFRWMAAYREQSRTSALLLKPMGPPTGSVRLDARVSKLIDEVIRGVYLTKLHAKKEEVMSMVVLRCTELGLKPPSRKPVLAKLCALDKAIMARARLHSS